MNASAAPWQLKRLLSAPHRLGFAIGAAAIGLFALWWLAVLLAARLGFAPGWAVPPTLAHGLLFTLGFMPAFMTGFLFTAGPRWLGQPGVDARTLLTALLQLAVGWLIAFVGIHASAWLAAFGVATSACGWLRLSLRFAAMLRVSRVLDRLHARWVLAACFVGVVAMLLACLALVQGDAVLLRAAIQFGLWGFVGPVYAVVSHRMIPFFSAAALPQLEAWRPNALLLPMLGGLALSGVAEMGWLAPSLLAPPLALASLALLALALRWGLAQRLKGESRRLLAMLHGGFVWLGLALGLQAASQARLAFGLAGLGTAPLHALTLGWLGCTLMAMVTRVAAGHSGRSLAVDNLGWAAYRLLQLAVLLRVAAALGLAVGLLPAAAIWAAVVATWGWRQGAWLGRPRVDGQPG
ncbi:MAG: NnrS family protein [Pelomonas sp.]|nr:NnrS family protein [Roseateles sp.]